MRSGPPVEGPQSVQVLLGKIAGGFPVKVEQALQGRVVAIHGLGQRLKGLAAIMQLAGPEHLGMACQDLLDQRGAGPRQPDDENRLLRFQAEPAGSGEETAA